MDFSIDYALTLDRKDPLAKFRQAFLIPSREGVEQIYFLGNSLGLQPKRTRQHLDAVLNQWSSLGVEAFFMGDEPWLNFHDQLIEPLASIVGAQPGELVVMNQLTVNLHLMMVSFYQPVGKRNKIICEAKAFPSDQYMFESHIKSRGLHPDEVLIEVHPRPGEDVIDEADIRAAIEAAGDELALVLWGGVNYYTGQVFDIAQITKWAHAAGAKAGFDLAHAAGNIPLQLHQWQVDFACWCSYKYLNAGPGAIAGAFVHEKYRNDASLNRFAGWWGYEKATRFKMQQGFKPEQGAAGWQLSTPSPLLYAAHKASLSIFAEVGFDACCKKAELLADYLRSLLDELLSKQPRKFRILTPAKKAQRGCQVSLLFEQNGRQYFDKLTDAGIFADWREPNVIRIAPVPLYNRFEEIWRFVEVLSA